MSSEEVGAKTWEAANRVQGIPVERLPSERQPKTPWWRQVQRIRQKIYWKNISNTTYEASILSIQTSRKGVFL